VQVDWQTLKLAETTGGNYAESARPVQDLVNEAAAKAAGGQRPVLVFVFDPEDTKTNDSLEANVFTDEKVGLALKRFACLRAALDSIPDAKAAEALKRQAPLFYFFDPSGKPADTLSGKRATSKSGFSSRVEKIWNLSFEKPLKEFASAMAEILDRFDKVATDLARVADQITRAADNPQKLAGLQKDEAALKAVEAAIQQDEKKVLDGVTVREEFRKVGDESVRK
jgi:hypothetical protein